MTIAILGGRFDPPHWGHFWVSQQVLDYGPSIEEVWLVPAAKHQWKQIIAQGSDRMRMLHFLETPQIRVSDIELTRGGVSYSVDTIKEIKDKYNHKIYWIVGSDIIPEFSRWEKAEELTNSATFLVFPRDPYAVPQILPHGFEEVNNPDLVTSNLSSTVIRKRLKEDRSVHGLVPERVEEYIKEKKLYQ